MALVTLNFDFPVNVSCEIGDTIYYCVTTATGVHTSVTHLNNMFILGQAISVSTFVIVVDTGNSTNIPTVDDFIMFSKDNAANLSSLVGYFAEVKMVNDSTKEAELFHVSSEIFESSK
tara:strand:- start:1494 stop:1847 length:354 start_codon:yes stop_codon:yes gene_type:complete